MTFPIARLRHPLGLWPSGCLLQTRPRLAAGNVPDSTHPPGSSAKCRMEGCQDDTEETLSHSLIYCQANDGVGVRLLDCIRGVQPDLGAEAAVRLELQIDAEHELP